MGSAAARGLRVVDDETVNIGRLQLAEPHVVLPKPSREQPSNDRLVIDQCRRGEATLGTQEATIIDDDLVDRGASDCWGWHRNASEAAQVLQELPPGRDVAAATVPGPIDRPMERF